jgi:hypothetical protein
VKFYGTFVGARFNLKQYKKILENQLLKQLHAGVRAWIQAIAGSGGRVPLWSGMARASLLEIAQLVNGQIVLSPLKVKSRIAEGRVLGTALQIIENGKITIKIITDVSHYNIQEYKKVASGGSRSAPWRSREAGMIAFESSISGTVLTPPKILPVKIKAV